MNSDSHMVKFQEVCYILEITNSLSVDKRNLILSLFNQKSRLRCVRVLTLKRSKFIQLVCFTPDNQAYHSMKMVFMQLSTYSSACQMVTLSSSNLRQKVAGARRVHSNLLENSPSWMSMTYFRSRTTTYWPAEMEVNSPLWTYPAWKLLLSPKSMDLLKLARLGF